MITAINSSNFDAEVINSAKPILVDFYADWCGPCKMMGPVIDELAEEITDISFGKLNVDESSDIAISLRVASIPTLIIFKDGKVAARTVGFQSKDDVLKLIEEAKNA